MAAEPAENVPLRSEESDDEPNNPEEPKPAAIPNQQQQQQQQQPLEQESIEPGQERSKDAQDYIENVGVACNKCYNWFPIGLFGWIGGWVLIVCCVVDLIITQLTFTQFFVIALLICGGLIMLLVEMPSQIVQKQRGLQKVQLALYEWMKLLSRMWGKAIYCLVLCVMCFSEMGGGFRSIPWIAGLYMAVLIILYFIFGLLAAKKYNGLYVYISTNTQIEINENINVSVDLNVDEKKDEEIIQQQPQAQAQIENVTVKNDNDMLRKKFAQKFDEIDMDNDGKVGPKDIARLGVEANLELSNSECHAIVCYLDGDCNGVIIKEDWMRMWEKNTRQIWM